LVDLDVQVVPTRPAGPVAHPVRQGSGRGSPARLRRPLEFARRSAV